jgi:hypothetical protein
VHSASAAEIRSKVHVEHFDLLFNELPLIPEHVDQASHLRCRVRRGVLHDICHGSLEDRWPLRKNHPALEQKCPKLIDHRSASADPAIMDPVDTLEVQLIIGLDWDKTHVLPLDGSAIASASMKSFLFEFTKGFTN